MADITKKTHRVALLDDDPLFCRATQRQLESLGISCIVAHELNDLLPRLQRDPPDLILLDLELGGEDGHTACRKLRSLSELPIIMLTGTESADMVVSCLEVGADDYVTKPFDADELCARIRAVVRRRASAKPELDTVSAHHLFETLTLNVITSWITADQGDMQLSNTEAALLSTLMDAAPRNVDREQLSRAALRRSWAAGDRTIDVLVGRLRKKLRVIASTVDIYTVRGAGYALRATPLNQPR